MKKLVPLLCLGLALLPAEAGLFSEVDQLSASEVKTTWEKLSSLLAKSGGIDQVELERARLQGVLQKLGKNARIVPARVGNEVLQGIDLKQEMLPRSILYLRLGDLAADNISQLQGALRDHDRASVLILDLRATNAVATYDQAVDLLSIFTGAGKTLFTLVNSAANSSKNYVSRGEALYNGIILVLVNDEDRGPAEVVAAVLRQQIRALIVGKKTRGEALDFDLFPINDRLALEVAVGRIVLPGLPADSLQNGVVPDLAVNADLNDEHTILGRSDQEGMAPFIFEIERPHMNEASLVAGKNPELDSYQARKAQQAEKQAAEPPPLLDRTLQRALDAATSLLVLRESAKNSS